MVQLEWREQHREFCGGVHRECGVLDNRGEEAKPRHGWVPYQHQMAKEFLALGLITLLTLLLVLVLCQ